MAAPRRYPDELRERPIRFAFDLVQGSENRSVNAACKRVGEQLGVALDSLRRLGAAGSHRHRHRAGSGE